MKFKLEDWLANYKPRIVGTNRATKRNNTAALRVSLGKARAVATRFRKGNRNLGNPVFLSHHLQSCKLLCVSTGVTVTSSQWSIKRKLDLF